MGKDRNTGKRWEGGGEEKKGKWLNHFGACRTNVLQAWMGRDEGRRFLAPKEGMVKAAAEESGKF